MGKGPEKRGPCFGPTGVVVTWEKDLRKGLGFGPGGWLSPAKRT